MVQWLGLCAFTAGGVASMPDQGIKIHFMVWPNQQIFKNLTQLKKKNVTETPYCMTFISFFPFLCVFKKSCENFISKCY